MDRSPWEVPADEFAAYAAGMTRDAKIAGDLALPRPVRRYLRQIEDQQADAAAEIRRRPIVRGL